ncbi:unnamed protein product [Mesocestoides corti]|uniref:Uncharacterized protein n=1 Tax=Mesocestoides corti TaxID=53468 RepID=A0A158QSC6_MESCO|nr:unnamed protein product [Mesocestoides corti]
MFYHMTRCPDSGPIKLLLAHKDIKYTDAPIKHSEWPLKREEIITSRVPALRIQYPDGRLQWMTESKAILRCLGMQYGLLGRNDMEMYHCDRIIGKIIESDRLLKVFYKNRKFHDNDIKEYKENVISGITHILESIDRMLKDAPGEYAAADIITIADFYLLDFIDFLRANKPDCLKPYPYIERWRKHLMQTDQLVAKFVVSRSWEIL